MMNDQEFKVLKQDEQGVSIFYSHEDLANAQLLRTTGYQEALDLLREWQKSYLLLEDTDGLWYCPHCNELSGPAMMHKSDCLVRRTRELLADDRPDTLPEMPEKTDFSSPGPPPI